MPQFPKIDYCIVCEDARPEPGSKLNVLGFFGLTPNVEISTANLKGPSKLLFLFGGSDGEGEIAAKVELFTPDGVLLATSALLGNLESKIRRAILGAGFGMPLQQEGLFTLRVINEGQVEYENTFQVSSMRK
jgi:hypothetical protein